MNKAEHNRELINDYLSCWERGDIPAAQAYWSDDMFFFQAGHSQLAGKFDTPEDYNRRWVEPLLAMTDNRWEVTSNPEFLLSGDDGCVVIIDEKMVREGKGEIVTKKLVVYTIRDKKITSCRMYDGDQGAIDDFWS